MKYSAKADNGCRLIIEYDELNELIQLENSFFSTQAYEYNRSFLSFAFKEPFDAYAFVDHLDFFRRQEQYSQFIAFLRSNGSSCFYVSCPPYCGLYPLEVSIDCSFAVYNDAISYVLERTTLEKGQETRVPIGHPMRGAGFVIMPVVFLYDETRTWALILEDSVSPVGVLGVKKSVESSLETTLANAGFTTAVEVLKRPSMAINKGKEELLTSYGHADERNPS